jgi:hypothetical protein
MNRNEKSMNEDRCGQREGDRRKVKRTIDPSLIYWTAFVNHWKRYTSLFSPESSAFVEVN